MKPIVKSGLIWSGLLVAVMLTSRACGTTAESATKSSTEARYPAPWVDRASQPIATALMKHGATGCGQYVYRESARHDGEYLVLCSRDGKSWLAYLVWAHSGTVTGPTQPPTDISPPA